MGKKFKRDRIETMPANPANRFSTVVELWPDKIDTFIEHCGEKSKRKKTFAQNFCYAEFDQWHRDMGAKFIKEAAEFFGTTTANVLTEKARALFTDKVKSSNSRKGSRGSRWCTVATMPENPHERLSCLVVKHGAAIIDMFIAGAKALECPSPTVAKAMAKHVDNLLYARFDAFQKVFPPILREFVCKFFGYEKFEDCFTPMRKDHLERSVDLFAFKAPVLVKLRRVSDTVKQLSAMGVTVKTDAKGLYFEMRGATHASDFAIVTTAGELTRRKLITERASDGNGFDMQDLEGSREKAFVKLE